MKMKKVVALLLAVLMVFSLAACGKKQDGGKETSLLTEKKGVTVPAFEIGVNGVKVTNETMAEYPVYEATVKSTNSSGTESSVVYIGFKVNDLVKAAKLEGTAGKLTATADDGYAVEIENGANENNMLAISKDGKQFKSSPWFVPCDSETTGDQLKGCVRIVIDGMKAPEGAEMIDGAGQGGESDLAEPDKQDKSDKVKFGDFMFKVNGREVRNADLEGVAIYKVAVQTLNKKGEVKDHTYTGFVLSDVLSKLGVEAGTITVVCSDGSTSEIGGGVVKNEYTILAVERDKETGENGTFWLAPCTSHDQSAYIKLVTELNTK